MVELTDALVTEAEATGILIVDVVLSIIPEKSTGDEKLEHILSIVFLL